MFDHYYAVIMAGGGGTRLWPLSRRSRPKQLINFAGEGSLFQMAFSRLSNVFPPDRVLVVTNARLAEKLQPQCPSIPKKNFIIEPSPKGTAPAIGLAMASIHARDENPEATMAVLTADHFIQNVPYFSNLLKAAHEAAVQHHLVTLGIKPAYPATGFGYIQHGDWIGGYEGFNTYKVLKFIEKPDETKAKLLVATGKHDWNSGMFFWRVNRIRDEFHLHLPELAEKLEGIENLLHNNQNIGFDAVWENIVPQTIDYGIMEKAENVVVIPTIGLGWYDVGSWDSLFDVLPADVNGNIVVGSPHLGIDSHNSLVYTEGVNRLVVTIGARNLIIVDTGDALLICPREESQNVKKIIELLEKSGRDLYL
jgi:mannose-1-phosphate guanylyltransferase